MSTVSLAGVSKLFDKHPVLHDINLAIQAGEFVVIVGPSGCGKSTLLRLIAGLEQPSTGQILINNQCVNDQLAADRDIAMVFQSYALYPHMTVYKNMAYALKMRKFPRETIEEKVHQAAEMLQLTDHLHKKPRALSGGQQQRVAIGRAIVRSPSVFLFDEPLSNLDAKLRTELRYELKRIHQQLQTTCIYVTHDQTEAMTLATRIILLNQGKIEQQGTPHHLYHQPSSLFSASFMGQYPANFINAQWDIGSHALRTEWGYLIPFTKDDIHESHIDSAVIIAVRPEHIKLSSNQKNTNAAPVEIEFIEDMGSDRILFLRTKHSGSRIVARVAADQPIELENIAIEFSIQHANLFLKNSGRKLEHGKNL